MQPTTTVQPASAPDYPHIELSRDPVVPIVVGVFPMRPVTRS